MSLEQNKNHILVYLENQYFIVYIFHKVELCKDLTVYVEIPNILQNLQCKL